MRRFSFILKLVAVVGSLLLHEQVDMPEIVKDGIAVAVGVGALLTDPKRGHVPVK